MRNFCRDLLSLFRDLLVLKIAGDADDLFETSVLSRDEMRTHAAMFSEADFLRFFNSLSETESKLKDATQSRYVLEIGLVKLIEMRRVTPVEELLERLAKLEKSFGSETNIAEPIAATAEKKTLSIDSAPEDSTPAHIFRALTEEPPDLMESPPDLVDEPPTRFVSTSPAPAKQSYDLGFLDSLRLPLPAIDSEELEHIEDTWLDNAFDERLLRSGDNLMPISNASRIVETALGGNSNGEVSSANGRSNGSNGTAAAPALESSVYTTPILSEPGVVATGSRTLPENATEEDLFAHAAEHPVVKMALRIFQAKIVEVTKNRDS